VAEAVEEVAAIVECVVRNLKADVVKDVEDSVEHAVALAVMEEAEEDGKSTYPLNNANKCVSA
jgi:hypothetical protein